MFQARVREGYLAIAKREPERVKLIDANGSPDEVFARVRPIVAAALGIDND
ncbi:MAG: hypothetical protein M5R36_08260 [Deltaproteobacteria bacterium]|nr:hypothetical protein [Deltaproteobacteria bacterium]